MNTDVAPPIMSADYTGETAHRSPFAAVGLTFISPGLGYMYAGHLLKGITVNLLFILVLEVFIIALSVWKFFPLFPALVLLLAWFVFSALAAWHVLDLLEDEGHSYVIKPYNHWVVYAIVAVFTYLTPIAVTSHFTTRNLWSVDTLETAAMYPGLQPGDTILIDRMVYNREAPQRGDLVAVQVPQSEKILVLRVVGVPSDEVRMEGYSLYLNDEPVQYSPLKPEFIQHKAPENDADIYAWIEHNSDRSYVIALSPKVFAETAIPATRIEANEYFLLADNRSQLPLGLDEGFIRDSRILGAVPRSQIIGRPLYIAWSMDRGQSQVRWDRVGLRLE